jgi:CubicO group peptidase (beta-lactamase class C family)
MLLAAGAVAAQEPGAGVRTRIARVENGLRSVLVVDGRVRTYGLEDRMKHYRVPAVSVAVVNDGRVEWARAWGMAEVETATRADTRTLFQAASISKPVTALAALRLVEQGRLSLDGNVNDRLRTWKVPESALTANQPVSLRGLLTHTAGLTVHGFRGYASGEPVPSVVQVLDGAPPANSAAVRPDLQPGTRWRYSGGGYTIVQLLLSDLTGKPFPQALRETVLGPIGMTESTYEQPLPESYRARAATGYRGSGISVAGKWHTYPEMAAAGLWTTPTDLARYILEVQAAYAGRSSKVISQSLAKQMLASGMGNYGLGPAISGSDENLRFSHGGANEGFRAQVIGFATRGQGAVVMTNSDRGSAVVAEIIRAIADEYGWPDTPRREITSIAVPEAKLREYTGTYRSSPAGPPIEFVVESGVLIASSPAVVPVPLIPTAEHEFVVLDDGSPVRFIIESGRAVAVETMGTRFTRTSQ